MKSKKRILVAPLNWGLGHTTRCIPIINALLAHDFDVCVASDGVALDLLKKEFPDLAAFTLPSYNITYAKKGKHFKLKLIQDSPKLLKAIKTEKKAIARLVKEHNIDGIISDNRLGVYHDNIPCVFITHQLQVLSGSTTWISTKLHQKVIKRFDECWVPDNQGDPNLSGKLGHVLMYDIPIRYLGPLSRFTKEIRPIKNDILAIISGPEPQRTMLESLLLNTFKNFKGNMTLVRGVVEEEQSVSKVGAITIYNYMTSNELNDAINESALIVSRSGYTTLMDLAKLNKKAFFIPTPGQFEQEYLAKRLTEKGIAPSCAQEDFSGDKLVDIENYLGLTAMEYQVNFKKLFSLFQGE